MKNKFRLISLSIIILILTACSVQRVIFQVIILPDEPGDITPTIEFTQTDIPFTQTDIPFTQTNIPTNTATSTPTIVPPTPQAPTPTRETFNRIRLTSNAYLRETPNGASLGVQTSGTEFQVFSRRDGWLNTGNGYIYFGNWVQFTSGTFEDLPIESTQEQARSRVGYNTLEVYDEQSYLDHLQTLCPEYMLVMDNLDLADRIYLRLNPLCGTNVIHRNFSHFEGEEFLHRSPSEIVSTWQREGKPHLIRYSTNEPSCGGNTPCAVLVSHEVELARLARDAGFTVSLGNFGVGKYSPGDVTAGVYNPLIQSISDYDHIFGPHEYTALCLCFGFGTMPRSALYDPQFMQADQWTTNVPFEFIEARAQTLTDPDIELTFGQEQMNAYYEDQFLAQIINECGSLPPYWHLGRSAWILLWAECTLGIDHLSIQVVHTEWGWDYMGDVSEQINTLRNDYGHPQYEYNLRGWRSLSLLWDFYYPEQTTAQSAYQQIKWAIDLYPPNHSFLLFAWSDDRNRDWTRAGFSFGNYGDPVTVGLQELLADADRTR